VQAMESGSDIGDITLLRQYEQVPIQTMLVFYNNKLLKTSESQVAQRSDVGWSGWVEASL